MNVPLDVRRQEAERRLVSAVGDLEASLEDTALGVATSGLYGFSRRHPWLYGIAAFILGGIFAAAFVVIEYRNWNFEGIDLTTAVYVFVFGCLATSIAATIAAFAFARLLRPAAHVSARAGRLRGGPIS